MAQQVINLPAKWETWVQSVGWEDSLEKANLPTLVFWGCKELDMDEQLWLLLHFHDISKLMTDWFRKIQNKTFFFKCILFIAVLSIHCRAWTPGHMGSVVVVPGLKNTGSVVVSHGLSCSAACEIFPNQGLNLCVSYSGNQILYHWASRVVQNKTLIQKGINILNKFIII